MMNPISILVFIFAWATAALAQGNRPGNSVCAQWCAVNFPYPADTGALCTSPAAHGGGPCYQCGPLLQPPNPAKKVCNGACVDTLNDLNNCGACGTVCPAGTSCSSGSCGCPTGQTLCNGACVDTSNDANNCSACDNVCPAGTSCSSGSCGTAPDCTPTWVLDGVSETEFNAPDTPFSLKPSCNELDTEEFAVFLQDETSPGPYPELGQPIEGATISSDAVTIPGLSSGYHTITVIAYDTYGQPLLQKYLLLFGAINMPIIVVDENDEPVSGLEVTADSTAYPGIRQVQTTDESGRVVFTNLPSTSIGLFARTEDNRIGFNGLAATSSASTLKLLPFYPASGTTDLRESNGLTGWTGGSIQEVAITKRATQLVVSTGGSSGLQSAHAEPEIYPFTKTVFIKYRFITSEVPGGYFGTQFNDYYIVAIRSNMGDIATDSQSMNGLGLGAFDAGGGTQEFTLTMGVHPDTEWVQFDVGVANVADNLYDSQISVSEAGDLTCDTCEGSFSCDTCPGHPICQPTCQTPTPQSCDFYVRCAEESLRCGSEGYPIRYGNKNCQAFQADLDKYSSEGQAFIWGTMNCLQRALLSPISSCDATCASVYDAAFDSHPGCYASNGFCDLPPGDIFQLMLTVNTDLFAGPAVKQILSTGSGCVQRIIGEIEDALEELAQAFEDAVISLAIYVAKRIALEALRKLMQQYL